MNGQQDDAGFVYVWFAVVLLLLLTVSALVIDILHGYSQAQRTQNAADAGALGGVVLMPGPLPPAETLATEIVADNVDATNVAVTVGAQPNQLNVEVTSEIDTFFANVIGIDSLTVRRQATAEYDPPIAMGSPINSFGNTPGCGGCSQPKFWGAVAGPESVKGGGNAAMSEYCEVPGDPAQWVSGNPSTSDNCEASTHTSTDYENSQYFVINKENTDPLRVDLYDPGWVNTNGATSCGHEAMDAVWKVNGLPAKYQPNNLAPNDFCSGDQIVRFRNGAAYNAPALPGDTDPIRPVEYRYCTGVALPDCPAQNRAPWPAPANTDIGASSMRDRYREFLLDQDGLAVGTTFELFLPDGTPLNPYDNETVPGGEVCSTPAYPGHSNAWLAHVADPPGPAGDGSMEWFHDWITFCGNAGSAAGRYTLKVTTTAGTQGSNAFAIAATTTGDRYADPEVSVYAVDRLGVYTNESTTLAEFYLARVLPSSIGRTLRVTLFDTGDFGCSVPLPGTCADTKIKIFADAGTTVGPVIDPMFPPPAFVEISGCEYTPPGSAHSHGRPAPWLGGSEWGTLTSTPDANVCEITDVKRTTYNGRYITIDIPIPDASGYSCDAADVTKCWLKIRYEAGAGSVVTDYSSWVANFAGTPVRIVA